MDGLEIWIIILGIVVLAGVSTILEQKRVKKIMMGSIRTGFGTRSQTKIPEEVMISIREFFQNSGLLSDENMWCLDEITWNDLEMDGIFQSMNRTVTSAGQEMLYFMLHHLIKEAETLEQRERKISWLADKKNQREQIQMQLSYVGKVPRRCALEVLDGLRNAAFFSGLPHIIMAFCFVISAVGTVCGLFLAQIPAMPFLAAFLIVTVFNIYQYYMQKGDVDRYLPAFRYIFRMTYAGEKILPFLKGEEVWEKEQAELSEVIRKVRQISRHSWIVSSGQSMSGNPMDVLLDYVRMTLHADLIQFSRMLAGIQREYEQIVKLYEILGGIDALISMASFRSYLSGISDCCIPEFCEDSFQEKELKIQDLFHPMMEKPVTNSFEAHTGVLVTGSNASGKSTFLKAVALCGIFAQTMHFCPASYYRAPMYSIMTSMALRDHLDSNESYYIVETRSLKRIMDAAVRVPPVLIVIDEILRGTNTVERIASSSHILKALNERDTMVLAATHDIELADIMANHYTNFHFQEQIVQKEIQFDYKLYSGKAVSRNAIRLLEQLGFDEKVTKEAEQMAQRFEENNEWDKI